MSLERAKKRQQSAGEAVAAIGRIKIEPTDGTDNQVEKMVEILGLQMRALHALCLSMRDVLIALENRDPDTETGPDDEALPPAGDPAGGDPAGGGSDDGKAAGTDGQKASDGIDK